MPNLEQISELMKSRRSIRVYQDKAVSRDLINRTISIARYAPTGHNAQGINWLVVDSPQEMKRLRAVGAEWMGWLLQNQPRLASYFGFPQMIKDYESGHDRFLRNAPAVVITFARKDNPVTNIDCIGALSYFDLASRGLGLGCCWAGFLQMAATSYPPMIQTFNIPENQQIYGSLMVGYPLYSYRRIPQRNSANITWR